MGSARLRWPWLVALVALCAPACQQTSKTYVVVNFKGTSAAPIYDIEIELTLGSQTDSVSFKDASGGEIRLPTTAALEITSGEGDLIAVAHAYDNSGSWVADGSDSVPVKAGKSASLHITFTAPGRDAGADGPSSPDLATVADDAPVKEVPAPHPDGAGGTGGEVTPFGAGGTTSGAGGITSPLVDAAAGGSGGATTPPVGVGGYSGNNGGATTTLPPTGTGGSNSGGITSAPPAGTGGSNAGSGGATPTGPRIVVTPQPLDFGAVIVGKVSAPAVLTVTNTGDQPTKPLTESVGDGRRFSIVGDRCTGTALGPGFSCTLTFTFSPDAVGNLQTGGSVTPDQGQPVTFVMTGRGLNSAPQITMSPNTVDFDILDVGISNSMDFKVTSTGGSDPGAVEILLGGGNGFSVVNNDCANISLPKDGRCVFTLMFIPSTFGKAQIAIDAKSSSGAAATSYATGIGRDFVNLSVKLAGTGSGTVVGNGLSCSPSSSCTISIARVDATTLPKFSLTARPDATSKFSGWSGPCAGTATCDGVMDGTKYITATFDSL